MAYDKNRNDRDDPLLMGAPEAKVHAPITISAAQVMGNANLPTHGGDERAMLVARTPGHYPVGGQFVTLTMQGSNAPFVNVLNWYAEDDVSRKGVIVAAAAQWSITAGSQTRLRIGAALRITVGGPRGAYVFWAVAPCFIPVQGTYVRVDAQLALLPGQVTGTNLNTLAPNAVPANNDTWQGQVAVNFYDDVISEPDSVILGSSLAPAGTTAIFSVPCIATALQIANTNAVGVWAVIADTVGAGTGAGGTSLQQVKGVVYCPGNSTTYVGRDVLGSFGSGVCVFGVADPTVAGTGWTEDANDAKLLCTLRGYTITQGAS